MSVALLAAAHAEGVAIDFGPDGRQLTLDEVRFLIEHPPIFVRNREGGMDEHDVLVAFREETRSDLECEGCSNQAPDAAYYYSWDGGAFGGVTICSACLFMALVHPELDSKIYIIAYGPCEDMKKWGL